LSGWIKHFKILFFFIFLNAAEPVSFIFPPKRRTFAENDDCLPDVETFLELEEEEEEEEEKKKNSERAQNRNQIAKKDPFREKKRGEF